MSIENATIVVNAGKIAQVGRAADVKAPAGATRVSLTGKTVMPTIVDTHVHTSQTREALTQDLQRRAYYGVSAALSMGQDTEAAAFDLRAMPIPGAARIFSAGRGLTAPEPGRTMAPYWITTAAEGRKAVQEQAARKVDIIKIWVDDRDGKFMKLTPELYGAVIDEAHKNKLRVTAHLFTLQDAKGLWKAGIDAFAHGVRDRDVDEEFMAMLKTRPAFVLAPNLPDRGVKTDLSWLKDSLSAGELQKLEAANTDRPEAQTQFGIQARNLAKMNAAGVRIALGSDGNNPYAPHVEMADMVAAGMTAGSGDRRRDAQRRRLPAHDRHRHDRSRQERRLPRPRRQPARRHHQHAADLVGVSARRRRQPRKVVSGFSRTDVEAGLQTRLDRIHHDSGSSLRAPHARQRALVHRRCRGVAGARHRRQHRDLQPGQHAHAAPAAGARAARSWCSS